MKRTSSRGVANAEWLDGEFYTMYGNHSLNGSGPEAAPAEMTLVIRTTEEQSQVGSELQTIVSSLNGDVPVSQVETLSGWIREAVAGTRIRTRHLPLARSLRAQTRRQHANDDAG